MGFLKALAFVLRVTAFTLAALTCLALAIAAFAGCGAVSIIRPSDLDRGRTIIAGEPISVDLPVWVNCGCSEVSCAELVEAATWWNQEMRRHGYDRPVVMVQPWATREPYGCFLLDELPPEYRSEERFVEAGWVAVLQRRELDQAVIRHAIGHALGLDEDPPSTELLGLRSIMQSDAPSWGRVTASDAAHVAGE